jgi:hypothetical protein
MEVLLANRKPINRHERLIDRLLETPAADRRVVLMLAFQSGELRLSEADEVLHLVRQLESVAYPLGSEPVN